MYELRQDTSQWEAPVVRSFSKRAIQSVQALATNEESELKVLKILNNLTSTNVEAMRFMLLSVLLKWACKENPDLEIIVTHGYYFFVVGRANVHRYLWIRFNSIFQEISSKPSQHVTEISEYLAKANSVLQEMSDKTNDSTCVLGDLAFLVQHLRRVDDVMTAFKINNYTLLNLGTEVREFWKRIDPF
jgi:hypothetical protein